MVTLSGNSDIMSQTKVSDFFTSKKGAFNPSKKRKLNDDNVISAPTIDSAAPVIVRRKTSERKCKVKHTARANRGKSGKTPLSKAANVKQPPGIKATNAPIFESSFVPMSTGIQEVSACKDDHGSPANTPVKNTTKRPRMAEEKDIFQESFQTPDRGFDFTKSVQGHSVRKRLILSPKSSISDKSSEPAYESSEKVPVITLSKCTKFKRK